MSELTPEEKALQAATVTAFEALEAEAARYRDLLADVERRKERIRAQLPANYRGAGRPARGPRLAGTTKWSDAQTYILERIVAFGGLGLKPAEIAEEAVRDGIEPIASAPEPRLAVVAVLRTLKEEDLVYRAAHNRYRAKTRKRGG